MHTAMQHSSVRGCLRVDQMPHWSFPASGTVHAACLSVTVVASFRAAAVHRWPDPAVSAVLREHLVDSREGAAMEPLPQQGSPDEECCGGLAQLAETQILMHASPSIKVPH